VNRKSSCQRQRSGPGREFDDDRNAIADDYYKSQFDPVCTLKGNTSQADQQLPVSAELQTIL
jgi:hypothetical protein